MLVEEIQELTDLAGFALQYFDEFGVAEDDVKKRLAYLAYRAAQELSGGGPKVNKIAKYICPCGCEMVVCFVEMEPLTHVECQECHKRAGNEEEKGVGTTLRRTPWAVLGGLDAFVDEVVEERQREN